MASIEVSVAGLNRVSELAAVPAGTLRAALDALDEKLAGIGDVWGDDEIGAQWSAQYVPGRTTVLKNLRNAAEGLQTLSRDFKTMGVTYENAEDANRG